MVTVSYHAKLRAVERHGIDPYHLDAMLAAAEHPESPVKLYQVRGNHYRISKKSEGERPQILLNVIVKNDRIITVLPERLQTGPENRLFIALHNKLRSKCMLNMDWLGYVAIKGIIATHPRDDTRYFRPNYPHTILLPLVVGGQRIVVILGFNEERVWTGVVGKSYHDNGAEPLLIDEEGYLLQWDNEQMAARERAKEKKAAILATQEDTRTPQEVAEQQRQAKQRRENRRHARKAFVASLGDKGIAMSTKQLIRLMELMLEHGMDGDVTVRFTIPPVTSPREVCLRIRMNAGELVDVEPGNCEEAVFLGMI